MDDAAILTDLVDHGFEDVALERKMAVINETLSDVAARELWPQLLKTASLAFTPGATAPTTFPTDVSTILTVYRLYGAGKTIPWRRIDDTRDVASLGSYPAGYFYTMLPSGFNVFGAPDGNVGLDYFRIPAPVVETSVEADIWLPKQFHRGVIVNGSVYKLYLMEDDVELSREFERLYDKAIENARASLHMQNLEGDYIHVVNPDDWD